MNKKYICPLCCGDGKETCNNPDHSLISDLSWHEVGRFGCPCCGHDPKHKVPKGGDCYECHGTGEMDHEEIINCIEEYNLDIDIDDFLKEESQK